MEQSLGDADYVGRKVVAANPQLGMRPLFATIQSPTPEIFHVDQRVVAPRRRLLPALRRARDFQLVEESGTDAFRFRHGLTREAIYAEFLAAEVRPQHRKIAATLASTGSPAFFVHAAEASHGDLGMITSDDVMLALSWSGETEELKDLIAYSRRFRIGLIAVTVSAESTLGKAADVVLALATAREACPHNLAPTTSSLMQLALGDALAIALLESRGFTAIDFGVFHPRGKLGAALKFVRDLMHTDEAVPLIRRGAPMSEAIVEMTAKGFGCATVHAKTTQEIKQAFAAALKADGPTLIAIPIARQERPLVPPVD